MLDILLLQYRDAKTLEWIAEYMAVEVSIVKRNKKCLTHKYVSCWRCVMANTYNQLTRDKRKQFPLELLTEWDRVRLNIRKRLKRWK